MLRAALREKTVPRSARTSRQARAPKLSYSGDASRPGGRTSTRDAPAPWWTVNVAGVRPPPIYVVKHCVISAGVFVASFGYCGTPPRPRAGARNGGACMWCPRPSIIVASRPGLVGYGEKILSMVSGNSTRSLSFPTEQLSSLGCCITIVLTPPPVPPSRK